MDFITLDSTFSNAHAAFIKAQRYDVLKNSKIIVNGDMRPGLDPCSFEKVRQPITCPKKIIFQKISPIPDAQSLILRFKGL